MTDWRTRLAAAVRDQGGGHEDNRDWPIAGGFCPAAVLIAVTDQPDPAVILTVRAAGLRHHSGQTAFPGGRIDAGDASPIAAALREAEEELGIAPSAVEVIGSHAVYHSTSGFAVTPVVGIIAPDIVIRPDPREVAGWFSVPLAILCDPARLIRRTAEWQGAARNFYELDWPCPPDQRIWGVTAGIAANLARAIAASGGKGTDQGQAAA